MSGLPLLFKKEGLIERHQVEGIDPSDRYFNRAVLVSRVAAGYTVEGSAHSTTGAAVKAVVEKLMGVGFTRLRTRLNFKGNRYLAEKETWTDYPDLPA